MHRVGNRPLAAVPDLKAVDAVPQLAAVQGRATLRVLGDAAHRGKQPRGLADARRAAVPCLARAQNRIDVAPCRPSEPVARHGRSARFDKAIEPGFKVGVIDVLVGAAFEVGDAGIDAPAQALELERVDRAPLLQRADGVAHGLAGVGVFALLEHVVDEGVLLGREVDIAGRHRAILADSHERYRSWQ